MDVQSTSTKLFCGDWDQTSVCGHFHTLLGGSVSPQFHNGQQSTVTPGAAPYPNYNMLSYYIQKTETGPKHGARLATLIRSIIEAGHKVAITSYTHHEYAVAPTLAYMGLTSEEIAKIQIIGLYPCDLIARAQSKPETERTEADKFVASQTYNPTFGQKIGEEHGKNLHIAYAMEAAGLNFSNPEHRKLVTLTDDSQNNVAKAAENGCKTVKVDPSPLASPVYISQTAMNIGLGFAISTTLAKTPEKQQTLHTSKEAAVRAMYAQYPVEVQKQLEGQIKMAIQTAQEEDSRSKTIVTPSPAPISSSSMFSSWAAAPSATPQPSPFASWATPAATTPTLTLSAALSSSSQTNPSWTTTTRTGRSFLTTAHNNFDVNGDGDATTPPANRTPISALTPVESTTPLSSSQDDVSNRQTFASRLGLRESLSASMEATLAATRTPLSCSMEVDDRSALNSEQTLTKSR